MIDVAALEMTTTDEVVELVAVPPVAREERELQRELHPGHHEHRDHRERRQRARGRSCGGGRPGLERARRHRLGSGVNAAAAMSSTVARADASLIIAESASWWRCHANHATVSSR